MLTSSPVLKAHEIPDISAFIRVCLRLDPSARPKAKDLKMHDWMMNAFMPGNEWPGWRVIRAQGDPQLSLYPDGVEIPWGRD